MKPSPRGRGRGPSEAWEGEGLKRLTACRQGVSVKPYRVKPLTLPPLRGEPLPLSMREGFAASMLRVQGTNSRDFKALNFLDPSLSPPSKPPVSLTHLAAWKGRMASDRCGGGGRSSGTGLEGVTSACPGSLALQAPPAVGVERGQSARIAHRPAPSAAGFFRKGSRPGPAKPQQGCPPDAGG